jgi:hypothetical protein
MGGADRDGALGEHQVCQDRAADAPGDLRRQVGQGVPPGQSAERGVDDGHDRVEVRAADGTEH